MPLPHIFTALAATQMSFLDDNFAALGALTAIPSVITGTNTLAVAPLATTPTISAYGNYQAFSGVAAGTNTGAVTAQVSGLGALSVYKDTISGPVALAGGEIVTGNLVVLTYDSSLNAGAGGFHLTVLVSQPSVGAAPATVNVNAGTTISAAALTGSGTTQAVILRTGAPGGGFSDTTATATQIVGAIPGCGINTYFRFREINSTGQTQTLLAGAGVTVSGTATTATATTHDFVGVVTAIAVPAVTIYG
jgi:hypothetical protein